MSVIARSRRVHSRSRDIDERDGAPRSRGWLLVAVLSFLALVAGVGVHLLAEPVYHAAVVEDGPVEWATAAVYLVIVPIVWFVAARRLRVGDRLGMIAYILLGVGFIFIAGEEVSWGQRQIGFAGPEELVARNIQGEANLHNLLGRYALHAAYITVGLWGLGLGRLVARLLPFARPSWLYAPDSHRWTWFFPVTAYYVYVDYIGPAIQTAVGPAFERWALGPARFQELVELLLAVGFGLFVLDSARRVRTSAQRTRQRPGSGAGGDVAGAAAVRSAAPATHASTSSRTPVGNGERASLRRSSATSSRSEEPASTTLP